MDSIWKMRAGVAARQMEVGSVIRACRSVCDGICDEECLVGVPGPSCVRPN